MLEETSGGDLGLVEIQVKVEICRILTCFFTSLTPFGLKDKFGSTPSLKFGSTPSAHLL